MNGENPHVSSGIVLYSVTGMKSLVVTAMIAACSLCVARPMFAQDCATALPRAARSYDAGNLREVIEILTPCTASMEPVEREQAYRFLALAHLFRNEFLEADSAVHDMLMLDPTYPRDTARDPYELLTAMKPYEWYPEFIFGVRFGLNQSSPNVLRAYTLGISPLSLADAASEFSGSLGYAFSLDLSYHLTKSFLIGIEPGERSLSFSRSGETGYQFQSTYSENITQYLFPLVARYELPFHLGSFKPFVEGGGYAELLSNATSVIFGMDGVNSQTPSIPGVISTTRRTKSGFGFIVGLGASITSGPFQIGTTVRYYHDLTDIVDGSLRYSQSDLTYGYYYIDDDFSLRNFELSLTVSYPLNFRSYKLHTSE